jgi:YidC/Oxa1 family membrane protein insertase
MAKMRKFQPRIEQLKERYGDDKQKFQMAMLELYKKEKINPAGGCLPILIQMPVFLALYYVLLEVAWNCARRRGSWAGSTTSPRATRSSSCRSLNGAVMWLTQKMTPMVGMDPMQKKMMQMMPLVIGVMFAFFPAGLVLYWVTNGALGMLQQWWNTKRYAEDRREGLTFKRVGARPKPA